MSCCTVFCPSRTTKGGVKDPELSFHTFPKCPEIRDQWIKAVRRKNWEPTKYSRLCSKHFEESSFVTGLSIKKLKTDAIPVIFEGYPSYYQPSVAKKRKQKSENLELTPRKRKRIKASSVKTEDLPTTPRRAMKVLTSLSKARTTALRHLRLINTLTADPAQVQGAGGGEGSPQTKTAENVPQQAKPEEVKVEDKPEEQIKQEVNEETPTEIQTNVSDAVQKEEVVENTGTTSIDAVAKESDNDVSKKDDKPKESASAENWEQREQELLKKIEELEKVKNERSEDGLKLELKVREEEIDLLKARVKNLETELQAALSKPGGKNQELIDKIKLQHEELLGKARGMIFDKTKMVKNQELQIEALTTQVQSLKDINQITKDLLEIRNSEVKAMEERFQAMESRFKGEKERYDLVLKRAQTSTNINDDLRKEYETQLAIFKELREKYELRVQALVAENNRLKESMQGGAPAAPSSTG